MDAQESAIYVSIIIAVFVLAAVVSYFFYFVIKHHKKVLRLERESSKAQVEMLEKDRSRIATDLHDELAPMLAAVRMRINSFDLNSAGERELLERTNETIDDLAKRLRSISFDLMPSSLQGKGLPAAIQDYINYIDGNSALKIRLVVTENWSELDEQQTIHAYRIVQEIVHNTLKHARATRLTIGMQSKKNYLVLSSEDNGVGFNYQEQLKGAKGLGLKSLLNRAQLLQASLTVDSIVGKGTAITIRIPIPTADEQSLP